MGKIKLNNIKWHQTIEVKEANSARSKERPEPRDTPPRLSRKPSLVSPSQLSEDSPEEVESRESAPSSMMRPELSSEASSRTLSEIPYLHRTRQEKDRHRPRCRLCS